MVKLPQPSQAMGISVSSVQMAKAMFHIVQCDLCVFTRAEDDIEGLSSQMPHVVAVRADTT